MRTIDWYFDFISPFAYLQSTELESFESSARIRCVPVLFAGLLDHWENKGPAEIAPKRRWTFEHVAWLAHRRGIPLRLPPAHPFNPLALLRLSQALGNERAIVQRIFRFVWAEGQDPTHTENIDELIAELGMPRDAIATETVKHAIRDNTEQAAAAGVFGVPTMRIDNALFWGSDATEMARAALADDPFFDSDALRRARELPQGSARRIPRSPTN